MDSSDIYYSDNTEWIENTVLIDNQDVTWQEEGPEITVDFSESEPNIDKTLSENDSYLTAEAEDSNETSQYFSILESNCDNLTAADVSPKYVANVNVPVDKEELIIPDIPKFDPNADKQLEMTTGSDDQVILYRMEGSDDLYAVQLADDGNGNFQKYKYKVRQNENGQFEAIPGTIEIHRADQSELIQQDESTLEEPSDLKEQKSENENIAINIIDSQIDENEDNNFYINSEDYLMQDSYDQEQEQEEDYETVEGVHITGDSESSSQHEEYRPTEFISTNIFPQEENSESEYEIEELDEAFQDEPDKFEEQSSQILQHKSNTENLNIQLPVSNKELKDLSESRNVTIFKDDKHLSYLVIKTKEKENVSLVRPKLRSILKSNFPKVSPKSLEKPTIISNKESNAKLIKDGKQMNNVILKSTRQPRKQTITPVRTSDIVVQPLVYSLDGKESLTIARGRKKRVMQEVLQVSDESDPEFTLKPLRKNKFKHTKPRRNQKTVEITILDSDEEEDDEEEKSDIEVIEETENNNETNETKNTENKTEEKETKNAEEKKDSENTTSSDSKPVKNNKCPLCPKTFPRLTTLKKHMNIHSARRSLRSRLVSSDSQKTSATEEKSENRVLPKRTTSVSKYSCTKCKLNFMSESQFKRHQTIHVVRKQISPKKTSDKQVFIKKLRSHGRIGTENNLNSHRLSKPISNDKYKCEYCGQTFTQRHSLFIHRNSHKTFPCPNCKTTFTAKILLDDHLRKSCVKSPVKKLPPNKFSCEKCLRNFTARKSLQMHLNVVHRPKTIENKTGSAKKTIFKRTGAHGGVPMSLRMQQALSKSKVTT